MAATPRSVTVNIRVSAPMVDTLRAANHMLQIDLIRRLLYPRPQLTTGRPV